MKDNRRDTLDGYPDILVLLDNYKYLNGGHPQGDCERTHEYLS